MIKKKGFTLIEVLLALAVVAIALTALLKAIGQDVSFTQKIKDKSISHWVAMQGITALQLNLVPILPNQEISQVTTMLGEKWYWRAKITPTTIKTMQQITITVSKNPSGPFLDALIGYRRTHEH